MNAPRDAPPGDVHAPHDALTLPRLSASLAHELNNIAASLRGFAELGEELAGGSRALQAIFTEIRHGADRSAALAGDLAVLAAHAQPGLSARVLALLQGVAGAAASADPPQRAPSFPPAPASASPLRCVGCGVDCAVGHTWIHQALPAGHAALLVPPAPGATLLTGPQLRLAILVEAAHRAGWHVVVEVDADWLALAQPSP